ncbi:MAG: enoyl-CoA hydratase-related protein [Vicinamibacterales bacterium]
MAFDNLLLERDDAVAIVTINRPKVLNALDLATLDDLRRAMLDLQRDAAVRAIVLTGSGDRAFAAGADVRELARQSPDGLRRQARVGQHVFMLIEQLGKPVIAAINGYALGGGCELAMACTMRIAADTARIGQPEITLGLIPGYAGTQRLPRLVGKGRALELLLIGSPIAAAEAERIGLVNRVVPVHELLPESLAVARALAARAPIATEYILDAVNRGCEMAIEEGSALEAALFGLAAATDDMREGTSAFLEKRAPVFRGR